MNISISISDGLRGALYRYLKRNGIANRSQWCCDLIQNAIEYRPLHDGFAPIDSPPGSYCRECGPTPRFAEWLPGERNAVYYCADHPKPLWLYDGTGFDADFIFVPTER
jgi:hypothetical protein